MTTKKTNVIVMKDNREVDFGQRGKLKKVIDITGEGSDRTVNISVDCTNGDTKVTVTDSKGVLCLSVYI